MTRRRDSRAAAPASRVGSVNPRFAYDLHLCEGHGCVVGADEAGRGCLAGPLVAAAVCLDYDRLKAADFAALEKLDDSKRLSRQARAVLYEEIFRRARHVAVICRSAQTIDRDGLHNSNIAALAAALNAAAEAAGVALVDGFALPVSAPRHQAVVGGDHESAAIAAASVVAKVTRDTLMTRLHDAFPSYGFDRHVGYATRAHHQAIVAHGICELHRRSFASVAYTQLELQMDDVSRDPSPNNRSE